jgi:hypothetical protein
MKLNFYPESDIDDYSGAVNFFEKFWKEDGDKIIQKWEEVTGLKFYESEISVAIGNFRSQSHPLSLRFDNEDDIKKATLVHELGHRILYKRVKGFGKKSSLISHKFLDLVLYDVLLELFEEDFTNKVINWDRTLGMENGQSLYSEAWDFALQYKNKEERQKTFNDILEGKMEL